EPGGPGGRPGDGVLARHAAAPRARTRAAARAAAAVARRTVHRPRPGVDCGADRAAEGAAGLRLRDRAGDARSGRRRTRRVACGHPARRAPGERRWRGRRSAIALRDDHRAGMRDFVRVAWLVVRKDLTVEIRSL